MSSLSPTTQQLDAALKIVGRRFDGFSGNCALFAVTLNRVLGGAGTYVVVDGDHYRYVDHVYLVYRNRLFDADGMTTRSAVVADLREEFDDDTLEETRARLQDFPDPSDEGRAVRAVVDECNVLRGRWDPEDLEEALREALTASAEADPGRSPRGSN